MQISLARRLYLLRWWRSLLFAGRCLLRADRLLPIRVNRPPSRGRKGGAATHALQRLRRGHCVVEPHGRPCKPWVITILEPAARLAACAVTRQMPR